MGSNTKYQVPNTKYRIIISAIEHESILETARDLEKGGVEVIYLPVDKNGRVALGQLERALNKNTILVSVMSANNETGAIQPITEVSQIIRGFKSNQSYKSSVISYPLFHTDAAQAFQYLDCDVNRLGVDLMTLSSHKIYGPKGAGCLYVRGLDSSGNKSPLAPIITGGGQEFETRSGTENIPALVGFARAAEIASALRHRESERIRKLRDRLWVGIKKMFNKLEVNGSLKDSLPNILNVYFSDFTAEDLLIKLDMVGIAVSAGSACATRALEVSHVLTAMGLGEKRVRSSIRFSLGRMTTREEIDQAIKSIDAIIHKTTI